MIFCLLNNILNIVTSMADSDEPTNFKFLKSGDNQVYTSSRDYTGQGYATYPNGDQYNGDYIDGIR